jgi:hypothetical protein
MKRLMILAVMLALVAAAAIPALAQDREQDTGNARENPGGSVVANTNPADGGSGDGDVSYNADPAPADGDSETPVAAPADAPKSGSGSEIVVPAPEEDADSGGCSDAGKISPAPAAKDGDDGGSVTAASVPGCSYVVIEK